MRSRPKGVDRQRIRRPAGPAPFLLLFLSAFSAMGCAPKPLPRSPASSCTPRCSGDRGCGDLDGKLIAARQPLLQCIGHQASRGHLAEAHRCYRSLRLIESARWWLKTLSSPNELDAVYQPSEKMRQEFICRIEKLTQAKTPAEVETLYLEMIRAFP